MMTKTRMLAIEVTLKHAEDALAVGRILNLDDPAELRERIATPPARLGGVRLTGYDGLGRPVGEPGQYPVVGGMRRLTYDGNDLAPGVYLYVLEGAGARATGRLVIAR